MQSRIATRQSVAPDSLAPLLEAVEARMLASIGTNAQGASKKAGGARHAAAYHLSAGGQRVRARIALQAGLAVGLSTADAITIAATVELLHNASLVHDDIQDRDEVRRGQQAVWFRFGVNIAICAGDLLLSAAYATLCKLEDPQASHALARMISLVHERTAMAIDGQCADLTAGTPTLGNNATAITQYEQIAMAKSGALLSLPVELVLMASSHEEYLPDAWHAAGAFAIGYQIVDDLHDAHSDMSSVDAQSVYNIVSVFKAASSEGECIEKAKLLGLEKINLAIVLAKRLPYNTGERLADYAYQLRNVLVGPKLEALIGGHRQLET